MKAIGERYKRADSTSKASGPADAHGMRLAKGFLSLAVIAGVLILIDLGGAVTSLAKGFFFVFVVISLYFVASSRPAT